MAGSILFSRVPTWPNIFSNIVHYKDQFSNREQSETYQND